jgi:hypothetical protein
MTRILDNDRSDSAFIKESYLPFARIIAFIKDSYFDHEREGRIAYYRHKKVPDDRKTMPLQILTKGVHGIPYVRLFEDQLLGLGSPIERIIIGPHRENALRRTALEAYLNSRGWDIEVSESQIPFVGR